MIAYVTTRDGRHTIDEYLAGAGASLRDVLAPWTYDQLAARAERGPLPAGTYVFADIERLDAAAEARALAVWELLQRDPRRWRTLNRPGRTLRRLALLQALHAAGINDFRAWPALEELPADARFPLFLRVADDHAGSRSGLITDRGALTTELDRLRAEGTDLTGWISCEYVGVQRPDGAFVKNGAFHVDGLVVPRHVMFGADWVVKANTWPASTETHHAVWVYLLSNPHADVLARVFAIAGVDFGRVDYLALPDGRIRVWEINTNAHMHSLQLAKDVPRRPFNAAWQARFEVILRALDRRLPSPPASPTFKDRLRWRSLRSQSPELGVSAVERGFWELERRLLQMLGARG